MEVITCHVNTDFDAFSSMVAAHKLHPDALMVFPGVISKEVKHFLILYKELFDIKKIEDINLDDVTKLIIVDTNSESRIGAFKEIINKPGVTTYVYDHHPTVDTMINANHSIIETVGANTTIMVNQIMEKDDVEIDSIEATILALGIYFDTNCLTFSATTAKDARALGYLLEKGAKLNVINSYMEHRLTKEQEELYLKLTNLVEMIEIDKFYIGISKIDIKDYISDIAFITRKILETRGYDAMFCVVKMGNKIYIVGRSKNDAINIGDIMRKLGGAGHPRAASATIKNKNLDEYYNILLDVIRKSVKPNIRANDIMTTPVKTIPNNAKIEEANLMISRYGHTGLPVVDNGKLVGIITRRDIEKALIHKFGSSPVKAYMSKNIVTIDKNMTLDEVENIFIEKNIGRVPVVEDGSIIGIITRTDILNVVHGKDNIVSHKSLYNLKTGNNNDDGKEQNIIEKMFSLDEGLRNVLMKAGQLGDELNTNVYVVGGFVRDLILDVPNNDIDIVVEGDGISFAIELAKLLKAKVTTYDLFKTALIEDEDLKVDVVTARAEYYKSPAALPTVREGSIKDDLFRRDFTINSMAIHLNENSFGDLVDYFGGLKDLADKKIRILHNLSFIDDPTRIFRAIKFEQRFKFKLESETEKFALKAVKDEVISKLSRERIWFEIDLIISEKNVYGSLMRLYKLGLFEMIFNVRFEAYKADCIEHIDKFRKQYVNKYKFTNCEKDVLIYTILYSDITLDYFNSIKDAIKISKGILSNIQNYITNFEVINNFFKKGNIEDKYSIYKKLNHLSDANLSILLYVFEKDDIISNAIKDYITNMKQIKLEITGRDILDLGTNPGPHMKDILEEVLKAKVNGEITSKEEEIYLASKAVMANKGFSKILS